MGLNWLSTIWKDLRQQSQSSDDTKSSSEPVKRILFIGFGTVEGFFSFDWDNWKWPNAADFDVVFVNCGSLYKLITKWNELNPTSDESKDNFPHDAFGQLVSNLSVLNSQILQVINSKRPVFVLAVPHESVYDGYPAIYHPRVDTYSWCPIPINTEEANGEVINDVNRRFIEYRKYIKEWFFYFDNKPVELKHLNDDLFPGQKYISFPESLFVNLSRFPLGIALRYGVISRDTQKPEVVSGPIYLLHYPTGGDVKGAIRSLLREFCNTDLLISEEPDWINSIKAPKGDLVDKQITTLDNQIENLSNEKAKLNDEKKQLENWRKLLYESGEILQNIVFDALKLLGLENAELGPKSDFDIIGEIEGETIIFEVKGLIKNAGRGDVFSLDRHIEEYDKKHPGKNVAKGILIINAHRLEHPDNRDKNGNKVFADDAIKHAQLLGFSLLDTRILYKIVNEVIEGRLASGKHFLIELIKLSGVYS